MASATLASLRTGHSHEDVDQCFGSLGKFVVRHARTVETPQQFADVVQKFCHGAARPYEKERLVFILDQHRDWIFACSCLIKFCYGHATLFAGFDKLVVNVLSVGGFLTDPVKSGKGVPFFHISGLFFDTSWGPLQCVKLACQGVGVVGYWLCFSG